MSKSPDRRQRIKHTMQGSPESAWRLLRLSAGDALTILIIHSEELIRDGSLQSTRSFATRLACYTFHPWTTHILDVAGTDLITGLVLLGRSLPTVWTCHTCRKPYVIKSCEISSRDQVDCQRALQEDQKTKIPGSARTMAQHSDDRGWGGAPLDFGLLVFLESAVAVGLITALEIYVIRGGLR